MSAGKTQIDAPRSLFHGIKVSFDALTAAIMLSWNLLLKGQNADCPIEIDEDIATLGFLHNTGNNLIFFAAEFTQNRTSFGFSDLLDNDLFGGLSGNTAIIFFSFQWKHYFIIQFGVFLDFFGIFQENMLFRIITNALIFNPFFNFRKFTVFIGHAHGRLINDDLHLKKTHRARIGIKSGPNNLITLPVILLVSGGERQLNRLQNLFFWNP